MRTHQSGLWVLALAVALTSVSAVGCSFAPQPKTSSDVSPATVDTTPEQAIRSYMLDWGVNDSNVDISSLSVGKTQTLSAQDLANRLPRFSEVYAVRDGTVGFGLRSDAAHEFVWTVKRVTVVKDTSTTPWVVGEFGDRQ